MARNLENRLLLFDSILKTLNIKEGKMGSKIEKYSEFFIRIDKFAKKFKYEPEILKKALEKILKGEYGNIIHNGKEYKITKAETEYFLSAKMNRKKGGVIPFLPLIAGGLGAAGVLGINKIREIIKEKFSKEKTGGIIPLLIPALGAVFAGLGAAGALTGGVAAAVNESKRTEIARQEKENADREREERRLREEALNKAQLEALNKSGSGIIDDAKNVLSNVGEKVKGFFDSIPDKIAEYKKVFTGEGLGEDFDIDEIYYNGQPRLLISHKGNGIYLPRMGQGIHLPRMGRGIVLPKLEENFT